jgi:hypothetical protein
MSKEFSLPQDRYTATRVGTGVGETTSSVDDGEFA